MAAQTSITLNDGKPTPVAHVFTPSGVKGNVAEWHNRSVGIPLGFEKISVSVEEPKGNGPYRVRHVTKLPFLEQVSGPTSGGFSPAPSLAYEITAVTVYTFHPRATTQDREDLRVLHTGLELNAQFVSASDNLEPAY